MAVSVNYAIVDWQDQIQTGSDPVTTSPASPGWGFNTCRTDGGGTLTRITDPLDSGKLCIQHQLDLNQADNRAQIGLFSDVAQPVNNILTHTNGVWVAMRVMYPEIVNPGVGASFISMLDFHAVDSDSLGNRWDTRPGFMLYRQSTDSNNMKLWDAWHGTENPQDYDSNLSATAQPIGEWFWIEVYYKFDAVDRVIPIYINGVLFHSTISRHTMNGTTHACSQVYCKWYGAGTWAPMNPIRYTSEFLMSNQGQMVTEAGGSVLSGVRPLFRHVGLLR